jgi:DNA transformation protein
MKKNTDFLDYVLDSLSYFSPSITHRAMFGGYGIYCNKKIIGVIVDDTLYFKSHCKENENFYKKYNSKKLSFEKKNDKTVYLSYWQVPEDSIECRDTFFEWFSHAQGNKQ